MVYLYPRWYGKTWPLSLHRADIEYWYMVRHACPLMARCLICSTHADLYGRGYSDAPQTTYDAFLYTTQLALLMQYLRWQKAIIVGYSMVCASNSFPLYRTQSNDNREEALQRLSLRNFPTWLRRKWYSYRAQGLSKPAIFHALQNSCLHHWYKH